MHIIKKTSQKYMKCRYRSGFRHDTANDQAQPQHAAPFDLARDTGTCKAIESSAVRGKSCAKARLQCKPATAYLYKDGYLSI